MPSLSGERNPSALGSLGQELRYQEHCSCSGRAASQKDPGTSEGYLQMLHLSISTVSTPTMDTMNAQVKSNFLHSIK